MKGKDFEELVMARAAKDEANGHYTLDRYGVKGAFDPRTKMWRPIRSKPDFEGVLPGGRQLIFDAKVMGKASFSVSDPKHKNVIAQRNFMLHRWSFGVPTFFLIHCTERVMATKTDPAVTVAFPCDPETPWWKEVVEGTRKSFKRDELVLFGRVVYWSTANPTDRKPLPNFLPAVREFIEMIDNQKP
jgi:hypothetical protein